MKPARPTRAQVAERKAALQATLRSQRDRVRASVAAQTAKARRSMPNRPAPRRRRRWWALLALLLLLLLLLVRCPDDPPVEDVGAAEPSGVPVAEVPPPAPEPEAPPIPRRPRPSYASDAPETLPWLASFRMQVSARSPRLAACFVGAERPGRLKWTAAIEPGHGRVSDAAIEPTLQSDTLTSEQRTCVLGVLADPPYRLEGDGRDTPTRVGMVIEF